MSVGDSSLIAGLSYLGIGRETILGTYSTAPAYLPFLSASLKTLKEIKILEEVTHSRTMGSHISLSKVIEGDVEFYFYPQDTAAGFILQNAMGGTITTATATGETVGGNALTHTFEIGAMDQSFPSLCINHRKGPSTTGRVFEYSGVRVNELGFSGAIDEPLKSSMALVCMDSSQTSNDIEAALIQSNNSPLSFTNGRFSLENSFGSLTSSSFWHVQSIEFSMKNSLKSDSESRRIGTDILDDLSPGMATHDLLVTMRFNTTTAHDAMISATKLFAEFEFTGPTMAGSIIREGIKFQFQNLRVTDPGDPEVGGPDGLLTSEVAFVVLRDKSSVGGYAVRGEMTNLITGYT